jgi:hypothetical protein
VSPAATASRSFRSNRVVSVGDFIMVVSLKRTPGRYPGAELREGIAATTALAAEHPPERMG